MTVAPSLSLGDRYTLVERIAVGGMGEVWRGRDELLGRQVAVKVLKEEYAADPSFLQRFRNEAKHTAALSHPGIANVFDYGELGDTAFLVMELVDGEPLSSVLARRGPLPAAETLDIVGQVGLALQAAHDAGVIHRDVKPGNLLIRPDGVVKVTDFGIARATGTTALTQTGLLVGTAAYLSPEQAAGTPITPASDIYSLGVVAYECLSGQQPFTGESAVGVAMAHLNATPRPLPGTVPPLVADFVMRALDKDPARRQASAGDFGRTALALAGQLREPEQPEQPHQPHPPTAVMPVPLDVAEAEAATPAAAVPADPDDDAERRRVRTVFVLVGTAVVVLGFVLLHACSGGGKTVAVPRVVGDSYAKAAATLEHRGLTPQRHFVASSRPRGTVLAQSVAPGGRLGTGGVVRLDVASGPPRVQVNPADYLGRPAADVQRELQALHLVVVLSGGSAPGPPGTVTGVDPSGSVREGTTVTVTVAAAPTPGPKHGPGDGPKPHHHGH